MAAKGPDRALADYATPDALWAAIDSRITQLVEADPRLNKSALQRQFGYERFLARIFSVEGDWVLKGGTALLCRTRSARHSRDIDLFRRQGEVPEAELVGRFLDPVLSGELDGGVWHPDRLAWSAEPFTRRRDVVGWT